MVLSFFWLEYMLSHSTRIVKREQSGSGRLKDGEVPGVTTTEGQQW